MSTELPIARNIQAEPTRFRDVTKVVFELRDNLMAGGFQGTSKIPSTSEVFPFSAAD